MLPQIDKFNHSDFFVGTKCEAIIEGNFRDLETLCQNVYIEVYSE